MKKSFVICLYLFYAVNAYSQNLPKTNQRVIESIENMRSLLIDNKLVQTGMAFDNRYQGVRGSPRMADTLLPSFLKLVGQNYYLKLNADIDIYNNAIICAESGNTPMFSVASSNVSEVIINKNGREHIFRTTSGHKFEKEIKENRFYQLLHEGEYEFIKVLNKVFISADYEGAYSADRRYDEFVNDAKYYIKGSDGIFQQVQLNNKSIAKAIPEKKDIIKQAFSKASSDDKESLVISILEQF